MATDVDRNEYVDPRGGRIKVSEWIEHTERSRVSRRPSTIARDRSLIANHLLPVFGDRTIGSITPVEIRGWIADLNASGLAADTVRKAHRLLANALEAAADDGLIPRPPSRRVALPRTERPDIRILDLDEINLLADAIDPQYKALVLTAALTGLRFGELAALRLERVNLLRRTIQVEETLNEVRGHFHFGPPKTRSARRTVRLPRALAEQLAAHIAAAPPTENDLLFTAPMGGPLRRSLFRRRAWIPAVQESVGEPLRFHHLRHTHAALLIAAGQHPKVIQERLGHASIRTTLDVYGHLFEGLDQAAADALDEAIGNRAVGLAWG